MNDEISLFNFKGVKNYKTQICQIKDYSLSEYLKS